MKPLLCVNVKQSRVIYGLPWGLHASHCMCLNDKLKDDVIIAQEAVHVQKVKTAHGLT